MSNATISVLNLQTEKTEWKQKLEKLFEGRHRVVLIGTAATEEDGQKLSELLRKHQYAEPVVPAGAEWEQLQKDLNLAGTASKEQDINRTTVHILRPKS
ncbi:MAG: hypothetical protein ACO1QB_12415 [Verrucomicrobiales bacterium]